MSTNPANICHKFRNWLNKESGLAWNQSANDWTPRIKEFFGKLGKESGFHPIFTSNTEKEYLVDIVWRVNGASRYLALAMESELSKRTADILEDFEKLVDIKARLKIGLFQLRPRANMDKILEEMEGVLDSQMIVLPKETYLIIFLRYDDESKEILLHAYDLDIKGARHEEVYSDSFPFPKS